MACEQMAIGRQIQAILKADMVRTVVWSTEERLTALIVLYGNQDHSLRGLTDRMDDADPRMNYTIHRMSYFRSIVLRITR